MKTFVKVWYGISAILVIILIAGFSGTNKMYPSGAPPGYSNSPGDGKNCTFCHGGTVTPVTGWITSDIPVDGYVPGTTYNITFSSSGAGDKGFEVSPQDLLGTQMGTLIAGGNNQILLSGKYVTHTSKITANTATWSFQWTAPSAGSGDVTFYGAGVITKENTYVTTLAVQEHLSSVADPSGKPVIRIFPNPSSGPVNIAVELKKPAVISGDVFTPDGKTVLTIPRETVPSGTYLKSLNIETETGNAFLILNLLIDDSKHAYRILTY
ncbi:MAG: hypothetical protein FJY10_07170 [Bacteroidetes bacterium]|nr:hypothetical protein [Bacteroidota bacterium]